ncbi:MAG: DUF4350 domain-containing protein, partial [Clavibacter sp.]|nr:DUF4350 domain-containing protein [Clavibacter sp.]
MSAPMPAAAALATAATRTPRQALRRAGTWIALAALAVVVALASLAVSGAARQGDALAPDNPAPGGTQALAR